MTASDPDPARETYRIGAVARLTGIPPDTLRAWERRYQVVAPGRAEGRFRLYSRNDIARLALIKRLVDSGHAIGSVARLSTAQLQARLGAQGDAVAVDEPLAPTRRIALLGEALPIRVAESLRPGDDLEVVLAERDRQRFAEAARAARPDVIVVEVEAVYPESGAELRQLLRQSEARSAVVVYGFGSGPALQGLSDPHITLLRAPVDPGTLLRACRGGAGTGVAELDLDGLLADPIPKRRFDNSTLAQIGMVSTAINCECPHHLVDLIMSLSAFEAYSATCESRSREDAALHAMLHATAAHARALLEQALADVASLEGIEL